MRKYIHKVVIKFIYVLIKFDMLRAKSQYMLPCNTLAMPTESECNFLKRGKTLTTYEYLKLVQLYLFRFSDKLKLTN